MRWIAGRLDIPTAGSAVRLSAYTGLDVEDRILWGKFRGVNGNVGNVWMGDSTVSTTDGWELEQYPVTANREDSFIEIEPGKYKINGIPGSIPVGDIFFDVLTNGDDVEWVLLLQ